MKNSPILGQPESGRLWKLKRRIARTGRGKGKRRLAAARTQNLDLADWTVEMQQPANEGGMSEEVLGTYEDALTEYLKQFAGFPPPGDERNDRAWADYVQLAAALRKAPKRRGVPPWACPVEV